MDLINKVAIGIGVVALAFVALVSVLGGLQVGGAPQATPSPAPSAPLFSQAPSPTAATGVDEMVIEVVVLETSKGSIEVELNRSRAPLTVGNFVTYVKAGFYDGTVFHRVISGFMIQGGGFTANATEKPTRGPIALESKNGLKNVAGTIAMARTSDPDSATSQFFINTVDNAPLDYAPGNDGYAVFGKVTKGMDVVKAIEAVNTSSRGSNADWPVEDVVITKAYLKK